MDNVPYRAAVGSLMYLMAATRPNLAATVGCVSQYMQNLGRVHWEVVKRIMRYVKGTLSFGLRYKREEKIQLMGLIDSDWGGDLDTRRSTTGYVFKCASGAINWSSKKRPTVALSSTEA